MLKIYGVSGYCFDIIHPFLENREMRVISIAHICRYFSINVGSLFTDIYCLLFTSMTFVPDISNNDATIYIRLDIKCR